jgi:hypothetical protein
MLSGTFVNQDSGHGFGPNWFRTPRWLALGTYETSAHGPVYVSVVDPDMILLSSIRIYIGNEDPAPH